MSKYEFTIDYDNDWVEAYYYTDDFYKIVYTNEGDCVGLYNSEKEQYPHLFGDTAVVEIEKVDNDFDYNHITADNVHNYGWKVIDVCSSCVKSIDCYENEFGLCDCICGSCGDFVKNCRYSCDAYQN